MVSSASRRRQGPSTKRGAPFKNQSNYARAGRSKSSSKKSATAMATVLALAFSPWVLLLSGCFSLSYWYFLHAELNLELNVNPYSLLDTNTNTDTDTDTDTDTNTNTDTDTDINTKSNSDSNSDSNSSRPPACSREELLKVRSQLSPDFCPMARKEAFLQSCSITQATKCVDSSNWVEEYYQELYATRPDEDFLAFSVGCNKGFDALQTLRMGTYDTSLNKKDWRSAMQHDGKKLSLSVCKQDSTEEFELPLTALQETGNEVKLRKGEMHCFEPMPQTVSRLKHSASTLGYDKKGYTVINSAVSKEVGTALFSSAENINRDGLENVGLATCKKVEERKHCSGVDMTTLKDYVAKHIDNKSNNKSNNNKTPPRTIHHLSIDVEGFDGDVLLGGGTELLQRVEYLEFEYNWMGSWAKQHLWDVVSYLDGSGRGSTHGDFYREATANDHDSEKEENKLSFTCYWAGEKRLWRITDCWMMYYDVHMWSNVACVNRKRVPKLADKMEAVFRATLDEDIVYVHPNADFWRGRPPLRDLLTNDPMLATEPHETMVSTEYI